MTILLGLLLSSQFTAAAWAGCGPPQCQLPPPNPQDICYSTCLGEGHPISYCDGRCDRVPNTSEADIDLDAVPNSY
jgi:hypothetical protein